MQIPISDFEKNIQFYLQCIKEGKDIYLTHSSKIIALISPFSEKNEKTTKKRPSGLAKGEFIVPNDFNEPLSDDYLNEFYK